MEPHLYLRKNADKYGFRQIQLIYSHKGSVIKLFTGVKTKAKYWNDEKKRIDAKCREIDHDPDSLNKILTDSKTKLNNIISRYMDLNKVSTNPPVEYVKIEFEKNDDEKRNEDNVLKYFLDFIEYKKRNIRDLSLYYTILYDLIEFFYGVRLDLSTLDKRPTAPYKSKDNKFIFIKDLTLNFLATQQKKIYFKDINFDFQEKFIEFLQSKDIYNSTVKKRFSRFKGFLQEMYESEKNSHEYFKKFNTRKVKVGIQKVKISLSPKEFDDVLALNLKYIPRLESVRDIYILGCTTGLRYSDLIRLTTNHIKVIDGNEYIEINVQKLDVETLRIPLNPISKRILNKFFKENDGTLKKISNQKLNTYLKELFKDSGIESLKQKITIERRKGDKPVPITDFKYNFLTIHTARKTFVTLCIIGGIEIDNIMKWTGHSGDFGTFYRYINEGLNEQEQMKKLFSNR